uniref:Uncharacterized protein n=1 Tax=viral metagenome TaxID=1070528 RepID=A0A6H2A3L7_9ZZZZ
MSFEGHYQFLCKNGHLFSKDCWIGDPWEKQHICPSCKSGAAWWTLIDETNGPGIYDDEGNLIDANKYPGQIDLEVEESAVACQCDKCGNTHISKPARYKIPENGGHKINQTTN